MPSDLVADEQELLEEPSMERRKEFSHESARTPRPLSTARLAGALGAVLLLMTLAAFLADGLPPGSQTARAQDRTPGTGQPVRLEPREGVADQPLKVERGKHLLIGFLQRIADATGEVIYVAGDVPPDQTIEFDRTLQDLDAKALRATLRKSRLLMNRERLAGDEVYLVRKMPERPPRKRGRLVRSSEEVPPGGAPEPDLGSGQDAEDTGEERLEPTGNSGVRVFRRADGAERSYIVIYETNSRAEAEEVARTIGLILADQKARR